MTKREQHSLLCPAVTATWHACMHSAAAALLRQHTCLKIKQWKDRIGWARIGPRCATDNQNPSHTIPSLPHLVIHLAL